MKSGPAFDLVPGSPAAGALDGLGLSFRGHRGTAPTAPGTTRGRPGATRPDRGSAGTRRPVPPPRQVGSPAAATRLRPPPARRPRRSRTPVRRKRRGRGAPGSRNSPANTGPASAATENVVSNWKWRAIDAAKLVSEMRSTIGISGLRTRAPSAISRLNVSHVVQATRPVRRGRKNSQVECVVGGWRRRPTVKVALARPFSERGIGLFLDGDDRLVFKIQQQVATTPVPMLPQPRTTIGRAGGSAADLAFAPTGRGFNSDAA